MSINSISNSVFKPTSVLAVDDEPFQLHLLKKQLSSLGIKKIDIASDGLLALDYLDQGNKYDLIITDLNMPIIDGVELMRRLSTRCFDGCLILLSGEDDKILDTAMILAKALDLTLRGFLQKPVQLESLSMLLEKNSNVRSLSAEDMRINLGPSDLHDAIDNSNIRAVYQPRISLSTMRPVSVEALARWEHAEYGQIYPDYFIPLAEQSDLIQLLTQTMLKQSIDNYTNWLVEGVDLNFAVNITVQDIEDVHFPDMVEMMAANKDIPVSKIILELTESMLMKRIERALDTFIRLRLKGITLSVDDFGTGYSNLAQLKRTPFTELKIDRSLVQGANKDADGLAILEASIVMGKKLGMHVIVEGIETQDELDTITRLGADEAQGYFISRPMSAVDIPAWINDWTKSIQ